MDWHQAVEADGDGVALLIEVTPGAKSSAFPSGYDAWRGRIQARVRAQAHGGRANKDVIAAVAAFFRVPARRVAIASGESDRRKRITLAGVDHSQALALLETALVAAD